ncbi:MAG: MarR family [Myxococcaceae bacterium]|nr:MarR family [Myxococcaceae bacterium]
MIISIQSLKRAFHSTVGAGLLMTRPFGLTPSRYELMSAIKCQRQIWYSQRKLRDLLGIAASTLTEMIDGLVQRGYLRRRRDPADRRRNQLRLTLIGRRALAYAFRIFVKSGIAEYVFGRGFTDGLEGDIAPPEERGEALFRAQSVLHTIHLNFGKEAYFDYAGACQPRPIGYVELDPSIDLWENDEPPSLKFLGAASAVASVVAAVAAVAA